VSLKRAQYVALEELMSTDAVYSPSANLDYPSKVLFGDAGVPEIPMPRWTICDALRFGEAIAECALTEQERACPSQIRFSLKP
jgi:hypothetical protein